MRARASAAGLVDAVAPYVVAVKPQIAFFEALGADGMRAFEDVCAYSRAAGLHVIADAKRGDIGSTARAYATALSRAARRQGPPLADALTVNPYLGRDSLEPFLAACRRDGGGIFCVVKTSNAGGADVQDLTLSDGRRVWHQVAELVARVGCGPRRRARPFVGRRGRSARRIRELSAKRASCCPASILLLPASARRARRLPTWPGRSRAGRRARSSTWLATSSMPSASRGWTGAAPPRPRRRSTPREVWAVSGW